MAVLDFSGGRGTQWACLGDLMLEIVTSKCVCSIYSLTYSGLNTTASQTTKIRLVLSSKE